MLPAARPVLPDFRNIGVVLRVAVLAEALRLVVLLVTEPGWARAYEAFITQGVLFEPVLLSALVLLLAASPWLQRQPYRRGVALVMAGVVLLALLWQGAVVWVLVSVPADPVRTAVAALATSGAILFYFDWRHRRLSPAWAESRLMALQARIQPHFLFNSLNSVLALVREDPCRAEAMLEDLADLFRALLSEPRTLVPLAQELQLARAYADIEAIRLGPRLRVRWDCEAAPGEALVPPLILQPLLENAVRYGVEPLEQGAEVVVEARRDGDHLELVVRNPVAPPAASGREGNHMALANIEERLALHFDAEARLRAYVSEGEHVVRVRLPVICAPRPPGS